MKKKLIALIAVIAWCSFWAFGALALTAPEGGQGAADDRGLCGYGRGRGGDAVAATPRLQRPADGQGLEMISTLISASGMLALVIGLLMGFGSEGVRWPWLAGGTFSAGILFWLAGQVGGEDV
jgi:hypothetical protein